MNDTEKLLNAYKTLCDPSLVGGLEEPITALFSQSEKDAFDMLIRDPELLFRFCKKMQHLAILTNKWVTELNHPDLQPIFEEND